MKLSNFIDRPDLNLPMPILDRIVEFHFDPVRRISNLIDVRVHSCYRPRKHEIERGRSGNSLHTFLTDRDTKGRGAIDISSSDMKALYELILSEMKPFRIARYNTFFHVDWLHEWRGLTYFDSRFVEITEKQFLGLI